MDERIEAFLDDVLALEREDPSVIPDGVRFHLAVYEKQFRDAETNKRMKDTAALLLRDTARTTALVAYLRRNYVLATGLNYPVVPKGDEEIRFQISADHTPDDIDTALDALAHFVG
jgi:glycine C-acetyltransferase